MVRLYATLVFLHACLLAGCMGQLAAGAGVRGPGRVVVRGGAPVAAPDAAVASTPEEVQAPAGPVYAPNEDRHWLQPDDYFISERPYVQDWRYVHLAKMTRPPAEDSKGQAMFFDVKDSRDVWTSHYWRTRPARPEDLVLGALAICFNGHPRSRVYRAPESKREARTRAWFIGRITDVSDGYKHQVRVSVYDCAVDAVRVVVR